jgi:hypothetical protein
VADAGIASVCGAVGAALAVGAELPALTTGGVAIGFALLAGGDVAYRSTPGVGDADSATVEVAGGETGGAAETLTGAAFVACPPVGGGTTVLGPDAGEGADGVPVYSIFSQQPVYVAINTDSAKQFARLKYDRSERIGLLY